MKRLSQNKSIFKPSDSDKAVMLGLSASAEKPFFSIKEMVENTLEIEFGKDFTKQVGFDKMVMKIAAVIAHDSELSKEALGLINKLKSDDKKNQQPYYNSPRTYRRGN